MFYGRRNVNADYRHALGLTREQADDPEQVQAAFRDAVRAAHPDNGGTGADVTALKKARDALLRTGQKQSGDKPTECRTCKGRGLIHQGFTAWPCPQCHRR